jgi:hypothetical protein
MRRNFKVNVTVRTQSNGAVADATHTIKAQSEAQARRTLQDCITRRGGQVVRFNWASVATGAAS